MRDFRQLMIIILPVLSFAGRADACVCVNSLPEIKSIRELQHYQFIALVKITDDQVYKNSSKDESRRVGLLGIGIIELFKGKLTTEILEQDIQSSCDMGIEKGEEWLVFGTMNDGKIFIGACDRNARYKDTRGLREWRARSYRDLGQLRKLYQHSVKTYGTETRVEYYRNKQIEIRENYVSGKLNEERKIWYPDGVLFGKEHYKKGVLHGKSEWFYPSGQIQKEDFFINGKNAHVSRFYYDSVVAKSSKTWLIRDFYKTEDSLNFVHRRVQPWFETVYDSYGRAILSKEYNRIGKIREETMIDPGRNFATSIYYHDNGLISDISYSKNYNDYGRYIRYDKKGMPSREWDYDEKGRMIKK